CSSDLASFFTLAPESRRLAREKRNGKQQHSLLALPFGTLQKTFIEKATAIKVNVLMALKRKEGD
ncbi:hypothetical protein ACUOCP_57150, partial [Escherichia sp. R-CC3]